MLSEYTYFILFYSLLKKLTFFPFFRPHFPSRFSTSYFKRMPYFFEGSSFLDDLYTIRQLILILFQLFFQILDFFFIAHEIPQKEGPKYKNLFLKISHQKLFLIENLKTLSCLSRRNASNDVFTFFLTQFLTELRAKNEIEKSS